MEARKVSDSNGKSDVQPGRLINNSGSRPRFSLYKLNHGRINGVPFFDLCSVHSLGAPVWSRVLMNFIHRPLSPVRLNGASRRYENRYYDGGTLEYRWGWMNKCAVAPDARGRHYFLHRPRIVGPSEHRRPLYRGPVPWRRHPDYDHHRAATVAFHKPPGTRMVLIAVVAARLVPVPAGDRIAIPASPDWWQFNYRRQAAREFREHARGDRGF